MTRLKQLALGGLAALAIGGMTSSAFATESGSFENRLSAATIGLPLGALPPPGLYTGLETAYLGMPQGVAELGHLHPWRRPPCPARHRQRGTVALRAGMALPRRQLRHVGRASVLRQHHLHPGLGSCAGAGFFGAGNNQIVGGGFVTANTTFSPLILSWNLGGGWFVSSGFTFMAPDGTRSNLATGQITPNPDYWTFEIPFAVSYLANNWNITGNFFYDINGASQGNCCAAVAAGGLAETSGNLFYGDLHALYKIGKWSVGPVAAFEVQTTADTGTACTAAAGIALGLCNRTSAASVGGLVGYDFGPVDLQVWVTDTIASQNFAEGAGTMNVFTRLGFRLWAPEAARPLVAKN